MRAKGGVPLAETVIVQHGHSCEPLVEVARGIGARIGELTGELGGRHFVER